MAIKVGGVTVIDDDRNVINAALKSKTQALGSISGAQSVDLSNGETITATITGNTTFTITGLVTGAVNTAYFILEQPGAGSITWPPGTRFDKGNTPTMNTGTNAATMIVLETLDNGTNWKAVQVWRYNQ